MTKSVLVVVTGLSGAGRSTALRALEDLGFFCVDNLPPAAFNAAFDECLRSNLTRVALGIDVRVRSFLDETLAVLQQVSSSREIDYCLLFLDASDASLLARFSATRRPHPLRVVSDQPLPVAVIDGIRLERERLAPLRAHSSLVIDTTDLSVHELRRRIVELFRPRLSGHEGMFTRFVSFGFKHGSPADVDVMFDVRFLDNPYFIEMLRPLSGLDRPIVDYVLSLEPAQRFVKYTEQMLTFLLPQYEREGKSYLTVGFGCTGGRHRSVVLAEDLAERLRGQGFAVEVAHRDLQRPVEHSPLEQDRTPGEQSGGAG